MSPARIGPTGVGSWLGKAEGLFEARGVPEARANAEFIMGHVLGASRPELRLRGDEPLPPRQANEFWGLTLRRARRMPLAYVLGTQPFLGLDILVSEDVLVPRPETEELVEAAIGKLSERAWEALQLLEIGTGSGCIALSLAKRFPNAFVWATEINPAALSLARKNAEAHGLVERIRFVREDLFRPDAARGLGWADLVISNPPYIPTAALARLAEEVRREPYEALDGGRDGLDAVRAIAAEAPRHLKPGGWLALEFGAGQGEPVRRIVEAAGLRDVELRRDFAGIERIALARKA